jgi:multiple sugar transport system permease protein
MAKSRKTKKKYNRRNVLMAYLFISPFMICFFIFIILPCLSAALLAFTQYDSIKAPKFIGFDNFVYMLTQDTLLIKKVIPNTFIFSIIVGPVGYALQFMLAWLLNKMAQKIKMAYVMAIYTPSIAGGVLISVVWSVFFSADRLGYLNNFLIKIGLIRNPIAWTQDSKYLLLIMIIVTLWGSMGVGFLSLFSGMQNVDPQLYEAGKIDGIKSPLTELVYLTIPSMKPQMLFSAIMSITGAMNAGAIGVQLSGSNPTPDYAGQLIQNHIEDFAFSRLQLGYATALSFVLLLVIYGISQGCFHLLGSKEEQ